MSTNNKEKKSKLEELKNEDKTLIFYEAPHKLKNTLEIVSTQKIEAENELNYLESIVYELENATSTTELDEIYEEIIENGIFKGKEKSNKVTIALVSWETSDND